MASWVLVCPECRMIFKYVKIDERIQGFFSPLKPAFSPRGEVVACKNCHKSSLFQSFQLIHQA